MNNANLQDLPGGVINHIGQYLRGNIQGNVDKEDSLKGLVSLNTACKNTNRATNTILNGNETTPGLKDILERKVTFNFPIKSDYSDDKYETITINAPVKHAVILKNISKYINTLDPKKHQKQIDCLKCFVGDLNEVLGKGLNKYRTVDGSDPEVIFPKVLHESSKTLEAFFKLLVDLSTEKLKQRYKTTNKPTPELSSDDIRKYEQLSKDAINAPWERKKKQILNYLTQSILAIIIIVLSYYAIK